MSDKDRILDYFSVRKKSMTVSDGNSKLHQIKLSQVLTNRLAGKRLLDAGCGNGNLLLPLAGQAAQIVGVDLTMEMLQYGRSRLDEQQIENVNLINADLTGLPLKANTFDLAYSFATLEYVRDLKGALLEMHRVVKPRGLLVIELGNKYCLNAIHSKWRYDLPHHFIPFGSLKPLLTGLGLTVISERYFNLVPSFVQKGPLKRLMDLKPAGSKSLDELISSGPFLRKFARTVLLTCRCD